jgi:hypothetical protein
MTRAVHLKCIAKIIFTNVVTTSPKPLLLLIRPIQKKRASAVRESALFAVTIIQNINILRWQNAVSF